MGRTKKRKWSYIVMLAVSSVLVAGCWALDLVHMEPPKTGTETEFQDDREKLGILVWLEDVWKKAEGQPESYYGTKAENGKRNRVQDLIKDWFIVGGEGQSKGNGGQSEETENHTGNMIVQNTGHTESVSGNMGQENTVSGNGQQTGSVSGNTGVAEDGPVQIYQADVTYFEDALFIGDSRTVGLHEYGDLGKAEVIADSGMSVYKVMKNNFTLSSGEAGTLEQLLTARQFGKIYIMLGINELGYDFEQTVKKYASMVEMIRTCQPDAIVFLQANLHISKEKSEDSPIYNNANIDRFNQAVADMADGKHTFYLDVNEVFDDEEGNLAAEYTVDHAHILGKYYTEWVQWILEHGIAK